ncbi:MAG: alpha/beta fold hydrolase [Oscillospiraceae bacterium]
MITFQESHLPSSDRKTMLYLRTALPESTPRGAVQIIHGISEHIGRYEEFMTFLANHGFVAIGHDHIGHGHSISPEGTPSWFAEECGWTFATADVRHVHQLICDMYPQLPCFSLGHSMGSFLLRSYLAQKPSHLCGAILIGTGHQAKVLLKTGEFLTDSGCRLHGTTCDKLLNGSTSISKAARRLIRAQISRDETRKTSYDNDPLCGIAPTYGLLRDMIGGLDRITNPDTIEHMDPALPVLLLSGSRDPVGEYGLGVRRAFRAFLEAGLQDVTMKLYHGARHEILSERNRYEVYYDILHWMEAHKNHPSSKTPAP